MFYSDNLTRINKINNSPNICSLCMIYKHDQIFLVHTPNTDLELALKMECTKWSYTFTKEMKNIN